MQERTIFDAVSDGNLDEVKQIIAQNNAAVNARMHYHSGETPLKIALKKGDIKTMSFLLKNGADTSLTNATGSTALHEAATFGNTEAAALLIEHKADINSQRLSGYSPLHNAAAQGRVPLIELLLSHKADVNLVAHNSISGNKPLHLAGKANVAAPLLNGKADINARNNFGNTPLHCVTQTQDFGAAAFLLNNRANVNARNNSGDTPLSSLRFSYNPWFLALLLSHGATVASKKEAQEMEAKLQNTTTPVKMEPNPRKVGAYCSKDHLDKNDACTTLLGILAKRRETLKSQKMPISRDTTSIISEILRQTPSNQFATKITSDDAPEKASRCAIQ